MQQRIKVEFKKALQLRDENMKLGIDYHPRSNDNLNNWVLFIKFNDTESPYYNQTYEVDIVLPSNYPFDHPKCKFVSKIFHPNIEVTGTICLNLINDHNCEWTAANTLNELAIGLQSLVYCPELSSPLNLDAGNLSRQEDTRAFRCMVHYYYTLNSKQQ